MKTKYFAFLTLMLCMGVFLFPMTAYARSAAPPTVDGSIRGDTLRIEVQNGEFTVEAIFVNDRRFNFRVDSALIVDLLVFEDSEIITVYAIDFAGKRSNVMMFINPQYVGMAQAPEPTPPTEPPAGGIPVTSQANPFTPDGQASVLDNATDGDGKEFFTFTTPAGNVFFLVVDRQRATDNVYFLNAVTERDLIALAEQSGAPLDNADIGGIPISPNPILPNEPPNGENEEPTETDPPPADSGGGNNGTLIFLLLAIAAAGGAGYYMKIVRPKQQAAQEGDDYEDEDNEDLGDEIEFEDDADDSGDIDDSEFDEHGEPPQGDYFDLSDEADEGESDERKDEDE